MSFDLATGRESGVSVSGRKIRTREVLIVFGKQLGGIEAIQCGISDLGFVCGVAC